MPRVLVCGSRNWRDRKALRARLSETDVLSSIVIHGGARGADAMAQEVCEDNGVHTARVDALWSKYGKHAGPLRNAAMLALEPDLVIAFSTGTSGTQHTIDSARALGILVEVLGEERQE